MPTRIVLGIIALLALTGNVGKPGAGWWFANLQSAIFDEVPDPIAFYPPDRPDGVARVSISTARLGADEPPVFPAKLIAKDGKKIELVSESVRSKAASPRV